MVVVGTNSRALRFARKIEARPELGYRIAGFVDGPWLGLGMFEQTGYPLLRTCRASRASSASKWWMKW